jgi:hypothetical protein
MHSLLSGLSVGNDQARLSQEDIEAVIRQFEWQDPFPLLEFNSSLEVRKCNHLKLPRVPPI